MENKIRLKHDSRSKRFSIAKVFGQIAPVDLPLEFSVKETLPNFIQPIGDVECVAITCTDIAQDKDNVVYDHEDLFNRIPHSSFGASPQDGLSETCKGGLLPNGQTARVKPFNSFYEAHSGNFDKFDSVRSALVLCKYPVSIFTSWYDNWNTDILSIGINTVSGHMYDTEGWKIVNGEPMLVIEAWIGKKLYMPRATFNKTVSAFGCGTAVLSTLEQDISRNKTILEKIKDACINVILLLRQLLQRQTTVAPVSPVVPPIQSSTPDPYISTIQALKPNMIQKWATLIAKFEGANPALNNPGNFKYSSLMASWGGQKAQAGSDGGYFCKFKDYNTGFQALCNFLILGCKDQLKDYHNARTIKQFTLVYTNHPKPAFDYSDNLIKQLGVTPDTLIKTFL